MGDIQSGVIHTIRKGYCVNCHNPAAAHVDGVCLFDSTTFREETAADHMDCTCEAVQELENPVLLPDGTIVINGHKQVKTVLNYISLSFTV